MIKAKISAGAGAAAGGSEATFFDRDVIKTAVGKANYKYLNYSGAVIAKTAKRSLRQRKKASAAGQPPSIHAAKGQKSFLKNRLFYGFDLASKSVVVGSELVKDLVRAGQNPAPNVLEKGGIAELKEWYIPSLKKWFSRIQLKTMGKRIRSRFKKRYRPIKIAERPYMGPAEEKTRKDRLKFLTGLVNSSAQKTKQRKKR